MGKKIIAAKKAIEYVKEGMKIGLGTGSTADEFAKILSEKVKTVSKLLVYLHPIKQKY